MKPARFANHDTLMSTHHHRQESDFIAALDFGGTKIALATADRQGRFLEQTRLETDAQQGAQQAIERAITAMRSLIVRTNNATGGRCLAAGVVSPGVILPDRVLLAPNVPGWEELALHESVCNGLHLPCVVVGNDVKAAALAEARWGSLQDADPAIFLSLGTGVAAALVIGGQVLHGAHGASGEIGYNLRGVADTSGASQGHAPLEEVAGGRAIGERGSRVLGCAMSAAEIFASTDVRARHLIEETLVELSVHVANFAISIDPARIAVGGGLMSVSELILPVLASRIRRAVPFPPEIVAARFVHDGALRGAASLALAAAHSDRMDESINQL